jgi:hypothetical protein
VSLQKFTWNRIKEQAAAQLADGKLTDEEIAKKAGITRQGFAKWKSHPEFATRVSEIVKETRQAILSKGIADKVNRVAALDDRWERMKRVIAERGSDPEMQDVAGGKTGLLVHQVKGVGKGEDFQLIDLYAVDAGLLKEMREHEKQTAQELGQWTEQKILLGKDGETLTFTLKLDNADSGAKEPDV